MNYTGSTDGRIILFRVNQWIGVAENMAFVVKRSASALRSSSFAIRPSEWMGMKWVAVALVMSFNSSST